MSPPEANDGAQQVPGPEDRHFGIQRIYVKDMSFEAPHSPEIFTTEWRPDVDLNLSTETAPLAPDVYNVVLAVTVTVKVGERTAFLAEVHLAGIFNIAGFEEQERGRMVGSYCPNLLFPYAREVVSDLVVRGGFPQLLLAPVNFDALYEQHLRKQATAQEPPASPQ